MKYVLMDYVNEAGWPQLTRDDGGIASCSQAWTAKLLQEGFAFLCFERVL